MEVNSLHQNFFSFNENPDSQNLQTDSESAKLAVIAGVITTFGDALATLAAVLAIEEAREEVRQEQGNTGDNKNMQKQIDYLTSELDKIKRQMNRPWR